MSDAIRLVGITKTFGEVRANSNINMSIRRGEILSLLGENGSGKTTLMNMLSGIYYPDAGQIFVDGREVSIASPKDAFDLGIGMIHQHFKLVDVFTAAENIVLGLKSSSAGSEGKYSSGSGGEGKRISGSGTDMKAVGARVREICSRYGFDIEPEMKVYDMSVSQKQTLEIVKALYRGADILILDEPTAVLTPQETEKLFSVIREMKKDGKAIVIITHKLHEVLDVSDRVAILRKGEYIGTVETKDATELSLTEMMVGRKVSLNIARSDVKDKVKRLEISNLSVKNHEGMDVLKHVSFDAYGGEILGIAGISGCGQKELLEAIAGLQRTSAESSIRYYSGADSGGKAGDDNGGYCEIIGMTPRQIKDMGITLSFVPEDRLGMGLVASMGMTGNMMLKNYERGKSVFVEQRGPRILAEEIKENLAVVTPGINTPVRRLSGGNVQKVLVGREISASPTVLMTAYAVRGLDIGTSYQIYNLLNEQKERGVAVIYVGEDLDVLIDLCDRILVLCAGEVTGIVDARGTTKEEIGLYMTRLNRVGIGAGVNAGDEESGTGRADENERGGEGNG